MATRLQLSVSTMVALLSLLRYAFRPPGRSPWLSLAATTRLAFGAGSTVTIDTVPTLRDE